VLELERDELSEHLPLLFLKNIFGYNKNFNIYAPDFYFYSIQTLNYIIIIIIALGGCGVVDAGEDIPILFLPLILLLIYQFTVAVAR